MPVSGRLHAIIMSHVLFFFSLAILIALLIFLGLRLRTRTRQLEEEKRLGDRTRTFQTLFNITRGGLALVNSSGQFVNVNPSCVPLFGYERDPLLTMNINAINVDPHVVHNGPLGLIVNEHGSGVVESLCRRKDGSMVPVEMTSALIPSSDGQLFVIFRDLTERRNAEEMRIRFETQLRQSQKLEAIGTLTSGIAHDFNNILSAILGNNELALQDIDAAHPGHASLNEIRKAGHRAKELVKRMTAFARPQESKVSLLQLRPAVEDALQLVRATLPATVRIDCKFASSLPAVLIDETQISQILLNLCTNAWQAMHQHRGIIEISVDEQHVTTEQAQHHPDLHAGQYVCLQVRDNGHGISPLIIQRIFEPFFTTKAAGEGTGLGLSIVHTIARSHGAAITVESVAGHGTTFRVLFPAAHHADSAPAPAVAAVTSATVGAQQHILYVDDEDALVFLTKRLLERQGFRVSGYTDPKLALKNFMKPAADFDLLITDQSMPGMTGIDLAREVLRHKPETLIVLVSGYLKMQEIEYARSIGIKEVITKPNTVDELAAAVHRILSSPAASAS